MTPFAGVGVNVAMEDALKLGRSIVANPKDLHIAVKTYDIDMFARAEVYAKETWMYLNLFFHDRGGHAMCAHFAEAKKQQKEGAGKVKEEQATSPKAVDVPGEKLPTILNTNVELAQAQ